MVLPKTTWSVRRDVQWFLGSPREEKCGESFRLGLQLSSKVCTVTLEPVCHCVLFIVQVGNVSLLSQVLLILIELKV